MQRPEEEVMAVVKRRKLSWFGHVTRHNPISNIMLQADCGGWTMQRPEQEVMAVVKRSKLSWFGRVIRHNPISNVMLQADCMWRSDDAEADRRSPGGAMVRNGHGMSE